MLTPELEASARRVADILLAEQENSLVSPEATNKSFTGMSFDRSFLLSSMDASTGFSAWVGPEGKVYWLPPGVGHTLFIAHNPGLFGISPDLAEKYKFEANSEIVDLLTANFHGEAYRQGWIRIRNYQKHFFVTCMDAHSAVKTLRAWAEDVMSGGQFKESTPLSITGQDASKSIDTTLGEMLVSRKKPDSDMPVEKLK